jgi:hypothetical protein
MNQRTTLSRGTKGGKRKLKGGKRGGKGGKQATHQIAAPEVSPYAWTLSTRRSKPHRETLSFAIEVPFQATAGGVMANVYTSVGFTPSPNWTAASALFQIARTKRMELYYVPTNKYDLAANAFTGLLLMGNDFELATALGSANAALDYDNISIVNSGDQFRHELIPPSGPPYSDWFPTSAPVATSWMKFFGTGYGSLQVLGNVILRWEVELLGMT